VKERVQNFSLSNDLHKIRAPCLSQLHSSTSTDVNRRAKVTRSRLHASLVRLFSNVRQVESSHIKFNKLKSRHVQIENCLLIFVIYADTINGPRMYHVPEPRTLNIATRTNFKTRVQRSCVLTRT